MTTATATPNAAMAPPHYPITFDVGPASPQSRLTVLLRYFMAIPHLIILYALNIASQVVALIAWFAILFTGKYPAGLFGFSAGMLRWSTRVNAYMLLLTGQYPPFSLDDVPGYPVRLSIDANLENRNRLTTFFRIIMVIPHFIALAILAIPVSVVLMISWLVALFTGRVPDGLHNFIAGFARWSTRANAYMLLLTDEYPPFSLS